MPGTPLVVVGASAGGIEAFRRLAPTLPADLPAAVAVVLHRLEVEHDERLARVLRHGSALPFSNAQHGEQIEAGHVYVAPAGFHLSVVDDRFKLDVGPKKNGARPSIDVLFRSAARAKGSSVIGIVLSGMLDDGTAGMAAIAASGGYTIVQRPSEASFGDMPQNALAQVKIDAVCTIDEMAAHIVEVLAAMKRVPATVAMAPPPERLRTSRFSCPDCGGVLSQADTNGVLGFRCRTGHEYSAAGLYLEQDDTLENALWAAIRALEERAEMSQTLAGRFRERSMDRSADRLERQAGVALDRAATVRAALEDIVTRTESVEADAEAS